MNAQTKKALAKKYAGFATAQLEEEKARIEALIAAPGEKNEAEIQSLKDAIEFIEDVLTAPAAETDGELSADEKLAQVRADESAIKAMVAGGLERSQAEAALKHKKEFAKRHAAMQAEAAKAAKK